MEKNKLVNKNCRAVVPGLEDVDLAEDIPTPRIKVSGKRGLFEDKALGSAVPKMECVLLTRLKTRTMFEDGFPVCKSFDRKTGSLHGDCTRCPHQTEKDKDNKLICLPSYEFLLMLEGQQIPRVMSVSAPSALGPAKNYISTFLLSTPPKPLFSVKTILSWIEKKSENKETGEKFTYFGMVFERGAEIDEKDQVIYLKILNKFRMARTKVADDLADKVEPEEEIDLSGDSCPF